MSGKQNLSTRELADELGVSTVTLAQARLGHGNGFKGLPYLKIGRRVIYRRCDIERFLELHLADGTDATPKGGA